jgi:hypothetical protein
MATHTASVPAAELGSKQGLVDTVTRAEHRGAARGPFRATSAALHADAASALRQNMMHERGRFAHVFRE